MTSVRLRLLLLALLPLVVLLPLLLGVAIWRLIDKFDDLLIAKVESDLRIAEQYLTRLKTSQASEVAALARSVDFAAAQDEGQIAQTAFLTRRSTDLKLDFLFVGRAEDQSLPQPAQPVLSQARPDKPSAALVIFSDADLARIDPELAKRARLKLVPTEAARSIGRKFETRGMILLAAHRIVGTESFLVGGRLLNRDFAFIDTITNLIYRDRDGSGQRNGTTTLFLDDVRISTNVRRFEGQRALGTRVSEIVWRSVMQRGETWLDRAFVVNDWYISGYLPIADSTGVRIGMLYTGFLEAPFASQRSQTVLTLALAFLIVIGMSVPLFLWLARGVFRPLEQMTNAMAMVEAGVLDARIGRVESRDEIGAVARHLDRLLDQIQDRDAALRDYAENLNQLVEKRTEELQDANRQLEATFAQLVMKEKLASIGEITAGVAHEINNPVAVIQGNVEVLRAELGAAQADHQTELDLIDAQTSRIHAIVGKLLNFAKSGDLIGDFALVDPRQAVNEALVLVGTDLKNRKVEVVQQLEHVPSARMVPMELQQVLVNLMINAAQAMPGGGTLTLATRPGKHQGVAGSIVEVADSGAGMTRQQIEKVFDPFFTTKRGEGTGLGLSISQTLVTEAGGLITAESREEEGSKFFVWLPAADNSSANF